MVAKQFQANAPDDVLANELAISQVLFRQPHPNVVTVMGQCRDAPGGRLCLLFGYCPGGGLADLLQGHRAVSTSGCP